MVEGVVLQFFRLLGWGVSGGEKSLPFATRFKALGVQVCLSACADGVITVENTSSRVEELVAAIRTALETGHLGPAAALSLRGRMQFARSQLSSRASRLCLTAVSRHAVSSASPKLSGAVEEKLRLFADILESSPPRIISSKAAHPWLIFTDASFEPSDPKWPCGLGGVLYDPSGAQVSAFSISLVLNSCMAWGTLLRRPLFSRPSC